MSTFPPRAPSAGDCASARLIWPAEEARHQRQRPRRVQLLRRRQLLPLRAVNTRLRQARITIVPGTVDTGNHTDDGDTFVALPFSFSLYDQTYNGVNVNSNGRLDFVCINEPGGYMTACLPASRQSMSVRLHHLSLCGRTCTPMSLSGLFNLRQRLWYLYFSVWHRAQSRL